MPDQPEPTNPAAETACPSCQHPAHRPGVECETRVDHGRNFHLCLCLNRPGADRACPALMRCQGGTLGYADIWHLQRGRTVSGPDGAITPDVLTGPAASGVQPDTLVALDKSPVTAADWKARYGCETPETHNWGCPCAPARPVPDTERRDRYAEALAAGAGSKAFMKTGTEWDHARGAWGLHADAAMAVADQEQRDLRVRYERELAHMREERGELVRLEATRRDEIHRLRAELGQWEATFGRDALPGALARVERLEAELEQARATRATVLSERADFLDGVLRDSLDPDSDPRYCTAIHDVILGLRRLAAESAAGSGGQAEAAHPESTAWNAEFWEIDRWMSFGTSPERARMEQRLTSLSARNPEAATRLVRARTTYTVEPEQAEDGAQQK